MIYKLWGGYKHQFREIGTGKRYSDKSSHYACEKCDETIYVPLGMQEHLHNIKGCNQMNQEQREEWLAWIITIQFWAIVILIWKLTGAI